jgi:hypothetical protein
LPTIAAIAAAEPSSWAPCKLTRSATVFALLAALGAAYAQGTVQRCESPDGKVTYSNTQCPAGTSPVRKVNTDPPVRVDDQQAAKERAKKDVAEVKKLEKERAEQEAKDERKANERVKADAKAVERCEHARRDLERARKTRSDLDDRAATVEAMQKADREISKREAEVNKDCAR